MKIDTKIKPKLIKLDDEDRKKLQETDSNNQTSADANAENYLQANWDTVKNPVTSEKSLYKDGQDIWRN